MADETARTNIEFTGETTQDEVIRDYEKMVYFFAHKFTRYGLDFNDLTQVGTLGLLTAAEKFNPSLGVPFAVFAAFHIRAAMLNELAKHSSAVRVPMRIRRNLAKVRTAREHLTGELDREPTDLEISEYLHIPEKEVKKTRAAKFEIISVNEPCGEDGNFFQDSIPDVRPTPDRVLEDLDTYEKLRRLVAALPARQKMIIQRRYGLNGGVVEGLQEIGLSMDCCPENVRVIEVKALGRLRGMMQDEVGAVR
jgi:RNA polymerase sigma factor (sigma-70 family)